ncbi:hypothetical protein Areg01_30510 [Actinoplanes regularis]|nr:hypothetical protein Areg01_30510 [Actinoplanes regularis]
MGPGAEFAKADQKVIKIDLSLDWAILPANCNTCDKPGEVITMLAAAAQNHLGSRQIKG